jgi:hypothetical protein
MVRAALGGDVDDPAADRVAARRPGHVAGIHCHPRVTLDVLDLLVAPDRVDHDMLPVGVDPGLGQLGEPPGITVARKQGPGWPSRAIRPSGRFTLEQLPLIR